MSEMQEFRKMILDDKCFSAFEFVKIPRTMLLRARQYIGLLVDPVDRTPLVDAIWRSKGMHELEPTRETAEKFLAAMCRITQSPERATSIMNDALAGRYMEIPGGWTEPDGLSILYDYEVTADNEYRVNTSVSTSSNSSGDGEDLETLECDLDRILEDASFSSIDGDNVSNVEHHDECPVGVDSSQSIYISEVSIIDDDGDTVFSGRTYLSFYDADEVGAFGRKLLYAYSQGGNQ